MKHDVFISYSSQDQKIVERICRYLEARGITCFVAYRDIPRGVVWARAIVEALDQSQMMVVTFSENFNRSEQVDREIELASEDHKPILTFRLSDCKFEGAKKYYLKNLNWIDAFPSFDQALEELYENICKLLGRVRNSSVAPGITSSTLSMDSDSSHQTIIHDLNQANTIESQLEFDSSSGEFKQKLVTPSTSKGCTMVDSFNGHEYVDLGLPSGRMWATCNVGAKRPEEFGEYFAWGEVLPKPSYDKEGSLTNEVVSMQLLQKGVIDKNGILTPQYDVASQAWGEGWRMPTQSDIKELLDHTSGHWGTHNGTYGRYLISTVNGNSLFLPASGWKEGSKVSYRGSNGYYWSSTIHTKNVHAAYDLLFSSRFIRHDWGMRSGGFNIRAVSV